MFTKARVRGIDSRAENRMPIGMLPMFVVALIVLIAAPIAHAATSGNDTTSNQQQTSGGAPIATETALKPRLSARLSDPRSISGDGIRVRAKVLGIGRSQAKVYLKVRRAGKRAWTRVAAAKARGGETVALKWRGGAPGTYTVRLTAVKGKNADVARLGKAHVFRRSYASYYGPGLYGGGLACGGRLSPSTVGVAHKTLPCGTKVTFNVGNRTVTTRVIDRGPFIAGRDWDLTTALKRKLGFGSTGAVNATR